MLYFFYLTYYLHYFWCTYGISILFFILFFLPIGAGITFCSQIFPIFHFIFRQIKKKKTVYRNMYVQREKYCIYIFEKARQIKQKCWRKFFIYIFNSKKWIFYLRNYTTYTHYFRAFLYASKYWKAEKILKIDYLMGIWCILTSIKNSVWKHRDSIVWKGLFRSCADMFVAFFRLFKIEFHSFS